MVLIQRGFAHIKNLFLGMKMTWQQAGFKGLYRRYGLKLFIVFFIYYLLRDALIYLIIPWFSDFLV
jgi:hypothetical protein